MYKRTISETEGEFMYEHLDCPRLSKTDRSKVVVLLWFTVACFWCQCFDDITLYVCFILILVQFLLLNGSVGGP